MEKGLNNKEHCKRTIFIAKGPQHREFVSPLFNIIEHDTVDQNSVNDEQEKNDAEEDGAQLKTDKLVLFQRQKERWSQDQTAVSEVVEIVVVDFDDIVELAVDVLLFAILNFTQHDESVLVELRLVNIGQLHLFDFVVKTHVLDVSHLVYFFFEHVD